MRCRHGSEYCGAWWAGLGSDPCPGCRSNASSGAWALATIGFAVMTGMLLASRALDACYFATGLNFEGPGCGCPEMPDFVSAQVEWDGHDIVRAALDPVRR